MPDGIRLGDFKDVDRAADARPLVEVLELAASQQGIQAARLVLLDALRLEPGHAVLDVGCGIGDDLVALAAKVGTTGRVFGADVSRAMIAESRRRTRSTVPAPVLQVCDVQALGFADGTFDACRAERVLLYAEDVRRGLDEMVRVTRRGGRVGVFDVDMDSVAVDGANRELTRAMARALADETRQPWIGRQLFRLFAESGLVDLSVSPRVFAMDLALIERVFSSITKKLLATGVVSRGEIDEWWAHLRRLDAAGRFRATITGHVVAGTRPEG